MNSTPNKSDNVFHQYDVIDLLKKVTIESIEDIHDATITLKELGDECGFRLALCDDISSRDPMVDAEGTILNADILGWLADGQRWWEESSLALESPIVRACRYESEPMWCNKTGFFGHSDNPYIEEINLKHFFIDEHANTRSYQAAILIPIHLPFAQISANSIHPVDETKNDLSEEFDYYSDFFAILLRRYISGYVAAIRKTRRIPSALVLSKREVECLQWAAIGKTDKEIALIMSLSHATIRYHIHRAGEKLYSVNRAQTIFKAGQLGFLGASS